MRKTRIPLPAATVQLIQSRCPVIPRVGLVLGSVFAGLVREVDVTRRFAFRELPGFAVGSVAGHTHCLSLGHWRGHEVAVLEGRSHYYEVFELDEVTFPVRVLAGLGVQTLLVTNAAGGIHPKFRPGDFMVLSDHINALGANPLRGPSTAGLSRFVDLTEAYDRRLQQHLRAAARQVGARCHSGVYLAVSGPSYETPAEIRAFRRLGADAVGMSTVPEVIVARQCSLRVAGLSCITNAAAGLGGAHQTVSHDEVLETGRQREAIATQLVAGFLDRLAR